MEKKKKISLVGSQQPTQSSMTQHEPKKTRKQVVPRKGFMRLLTWFLNPNPMQL